MAIVHPFKAVRPVPDKAEEIACVPYDVINTEEARQLASGRPLSFLHIIRPEIDLAPETDEHDDSVYAQGAHNLQAYIHGPFSIVDSEPGLFVYRLIMNQRAQTGIFACVAVADYDNDVILKHELTRPSKENDRTRHILEQKAHAEPVMLTFRNSDEIASSISATMLEAPIYDITTPDGVQHTMWRIPNSQELVEAFKKVSHLYVADGHHRCKAASRVAAELGTQNDPQNEANYFPAVLFPMDDMEIMAYNRVIRKVPGDPQTFLQSLKQTFELNPTNNPKPARKGDICIYIDGNWHQMTLPESPHGSVVDRLDVGRLTQAILEPMLGITDPRTDPNIDFIGGIRGTTELEKVVDNGRFEMAISMYPTSIEELVDVSDAGFLMPPKSTWFEPKLRSGLLVHTF